MFLSLCVAMQIVPFDPTKKKKKKKPVAIEVAEDESGDKLAEKTENLSSTYLIQCPKFINFIVLLDF